MCTLCYEHSSDSLYYNFYTSCVKTVATEHGSIDLGFYCPKRNSGHRAWFYLDLGKH